MRDWKDEVRRRLAGAGLDAADEADVAEELAQHMEDRYRELRVRGMAEDAAVRAVISELDDDGRLARLLRATRAAHPPAPVPAGAPAGRGRLGSFWQDIRFALRMLRRSPGFTAVAVITLALGIGASTTVFGVVNTVLLRPLPFPEPERLVRVWDVNPVGAYFSTSETNYLDYRARNRTFEDLAAWRQRNVSLLGDGEPEQLQAAAATASFFRVLGVPPLLGRTFTEEESVPGGNTNVAVLSHALWRTRFGGDPGVLGRSITIDGVSHEVVGVMPPQFDFPDGTNLWIPLAPSPTYPRGDHRIEGLGCLAPGVGLDRALEDLRGVAAQLAREYPASNEGWSVGLVPLKEEIVGPELRARVLVLLAAVGLLLLMACVNVANLLLARAIVRGREMSVRLALGARPARVVRQLLTESLLLALAGAAAGVAFAFLAVPVLRDVGSAVIPRFDELAVDGRVLAFGVAAAVVTGLLFGLAPALRLARTGTHELLRSGARVIGVSRLRAALIVASVSLAMVLLVGAGLVGASFRRLAAVDPGFDADGVLTASVTLSGERYREVDRRIAFFDELLARVAALPGVRAAGATNIVPFLGGNTVNSYAVPGREAPAGGEYLEAYWRSVTPGYFAAFGVRLRRGRVFDHTDTRDSPLVLIVSETMARRTWPDEDPVGQRIRVGGADWTVVGVVEDIRDQSLALDPAPMIYYAYPQVPWSSMMLEIRTAGDPMLLADALRREVRAVDSDLPVARLRPLSDLVADDAAQSRLTMLIFALFAAAALALAVVGVYGIVAYGVSQRSREIGVRLALGARPAQVVGDVVVHGLRLAGAGVALGLAGAWALSRFMTGVLYGIEPTDAPTYAAVAALLTGCAFLASLIPARAAARTDPTVTLRAE